MDRGRQIDNIQNSNAVYIDRFGEIVKHQQKLLTLLEEKIIFL